MKTIIIVIACSTFLSCGKTYTPEQEAYISTVEQARIEKDFWMENDPSSPFNKDTTITFAPLNYYPVDPEFVFKSTLYAFEQKDTIIIFGTKGEERKVVKHGYVRWERSSGEKRVNVYKGVSHTGKEYYSIWFTDRTTGKETYHVGRYIDFELKPGKDFVYTIDFNGAYNPYCAYSAQYSCAIPSKEDYIDLAIEAGEMNYH